MNCLPKFVSHIYMMNPDQVISIELHKIIFSYYRVEEDQDNSTVLCMAS